MNPLGNYDIYLENFEAIVEALDNQQKLTYNKNGSLATVPNKISNMNVPFSIKVLLNSLFESNQEEKIKIIKDTFEKLANLNYLGKIDDNERERYLKYFAKSEQLFSSTEIEEISKKLFATDFEIIYTEDETQNPETWTKEKEISDVSSNSDDESDIEDNSKAKVKHVVFSDNNEVIFPETNSKENAEQKKTNS